MLVTIITPSLNHGKYIEQTIQSVLDQVTVHEIEYLLIDGGSSDGTLEILKKYEGRAKWQSEPDNGQSDAINKGIAMANGEIIGWLNSDDLYLPGTIQRVGDYFANNPEIQWAFGKCKIIDNLNFETRKWITSYKNGFLGHFNYNTLLLENYLSQPAVFFRKDIIDKIGLLRTDLSLAMDYDLWIRLTKHSMPGYIDKNLAAFRIHAQSLSSLNYRKQFQEQYQIHKIHDSRWYLLLLHRINIYKNIAAYYLISKLNHMDNLIETSGIFRWVSPDQRKLLRNQSQEKKDNPNDDPQ